jgi:transposase
MGTGFISYILPEELLAHFEITSLQELGELATKKMILEVQMEEKNQLPLGYSPKDYESKGFSSESRIQDFPIRGKAVYLLIKRRRWRHKETKKEITSDYSFIAEGSKLTRELSDFLKGTGRDPGRYDK